MAVPDERAPSREGASRRSDPEGGGDRLGRHLDDLDEGEAAELRRHVDQVGVDPEGAGRTGALVRRDAREQEGVPVHEQAREGQLHQVAPERAGGVLQLDQVLEDARRELRQRQDELHGLHEVAGGLDGH